MTDPLVLVRQLQAMIRWGEIDPEGNVFAPKGALYIRRDNATLWQKTTDGDVATGWAART